MNTLKINIPEGFKIDTFNEQTGEVSFAPIPLNPRERFNTFNDVLAFHGHTQESFEEWTNGIYPHEIGHRSEALIAAAYNGVKLPPEEYAKPPVVNWGDGKPKGMLVFKMDAPSGAGFSLNGVDHWCTLSYVGARLVFLGPDWRENAIDAAEKFLDKYKQSRTY